MPGERTFACRAEEVPEGAAKILALKGRSIGIFRVDGAHYALLNLCPHRGASLCEGVVCGTTMPGKVGDFVFGRAGETVRCSWHGWEFDIRTGRALADPNTRVRTFEVEAEQDCLYVSL